MVDISGEILKSIKEDLAKTIVAQIDLNELAIKLYPLLEKIDKNNPKKIMERHIQQLQQQFNTLDKTVNNNIIIKRK